MHIVYIVYRKAKVQIKIKMITHNTSNVPVYVISNPREFIFLCPIKRNLPMVIGPESIWATIPVDLGIYSQFLFQDHLK